MKVAAGCEVELDYVMLDEGGETLESSAEDGPMVYVHGEGEIPPRLEEALEGADPGARLEVALEPAEAFGDYDPEGIVNVPRADFPTDHPLQVDEWIEICVREDSGEEGARVHGGEGEEAHEDDMPARVVQFDDEVVVLDTNHPLAGRRVTFRVEVLDVRKV